MFGVPLSDARHVRLREGAQSCPAPMPSRLPSAPPARCIGVYPRPSAYICVKPVPAPPAVTERRQPQLRTEDTSTSMPAIQPDSRLVSQRAPYAGCGGHRAETGTFGDGGPEAGPAALRAATLFKQLP